MKSTKRIFIAALIVTVVWSIGSSSGTSSVRNLTESTLEDGEDEFSLSEETSAKERYRRLIPYMKYYLSNKNVNLKSKSWPYYRSRPSPQIQRRFHYSGTRTSNNVGNNNFWHNSIGNKYGGRYNVGPPPIDREKFIPSLQYDPKSLNNEEYFTPVRYDTKLNFAEYQAMLYQRYNSPRPVLPRPTTTAPNLRNDEKFHFTTVRPTTTTTTTINFTPGYGDILLRKQTPKPGEIVATNFLQSGRPNEKPYFKFDQGEENLSSEEFESLKFLRPQVPQPFRLPEYPQQSFRNRKPSVDLNHIVKSLQLTNQLPEMLNAENIDDSIKTLVEILSILNKGRKYEDQPYPRLNLTPEYEEYDENYEVHQGRPTIQANGYFEGVYRPVAIKDDILNPGKPSLNNGPYHVNIIDVGTSEYLPQKVTSVEEQSERPYLLETNAPNSYKINNQDTGDDNLEDQMFPIPLTTEEPALNYPPPDGASSHTQNFPPTSVKYGATRGKPNVDYPAYATIPKTEFSCTNQRYKGFFGDPDTGCQVWHYCDLNGGKASFLCPNGTIFSQVALTCDWWFNVKCESTTQLYVLNERLYKYILPVMPKFPEDFSGPEVDRYLEQRFKEIELKMKEKKQRKQQNELNKLKTTPKIPIENSDTE